MASFNEIITEIKGRFEKKLSIVLNSGIEDSDQMHGMLTGVVVEETSIILSEHEMRIKTLEDRTSPYV